MKKTKILSVLISGIFIAAFLIYFLINYKDFEILLTIKLEYIVFIVLIQILLILSNALFLVVNLRVFNFRIPLGESVRTSILNAIGNFFTPFRGGAGIRAVYLKKNYNLSYSTFLSTLAGYYFLVFLINSIIALIGLVILKARNEPVDILLIIGFAGFSLFLIYLILFPRNIETLIKMLFVRKSSERKVRTSPIFKFFNRFLKVFQNTMEGWELLTKNRVVLFELFLIATANAILAIALYYMELSSLGIDVSIINVTIFSSISSISLLLSITPGSLGIKESLLILFQTSLALTTTQVLSASLVDKSINFFLLAFLALFMELIVKYKGKNDRKQKT